MEDVKNYGKQKDDFDEIGMNGWHFSKLLKDTLNKLTGLEILEEKFTQDSDNSFNRQISSIVILTGEKNIMISLSMPFKTATVLVAYMTDLSQADIKLGEQSDGIAEISNMIAGQIKARLGSLGQKYSYMQPFTIVGDSHHILLKSRLNILNIKFRSGVVELVMSVSVQ